MSTTIENANDLRLPVPNRVALAVFLALVTPAAAAQSAATPAQTAGAADEDGLAEVVVTGSRIRGAAPVGSTVITVDRDAIDTAAVVNTTQLIQETPQVFNLGVSENSRGQSGGNSNITLGSTINIRGLGAFATLVLVDGHRAVPQGTSGLAVDPSSIPTIALERVEIVADGASAIYGSDAVAGVANLVLRRNVEGFEVRGRYGSADEADEHQVAAIFGRSWDSGQITLAAERGFRSNLSGTDRDFFRADTRDAGGRDYRARLCQPGNIVVGAGATAVSYAIPAGGVTPATAANLRAATFNLCDPNKAQDLLPEQTRNGASLTFDQSFGERWKLRGDAFWTHRSYENIGPHPSATLTVPATNAFFVTPPGAVLTPCPAAAGAPAGTLCETVQYQYANDVVPRTAVGFSKAQQITLGLEVDLGRDWQARLDYGYGYNEDQNYSRSANAAPLAAALRSSTPATALNPFGGPNDPALLDGIFSNFQLAYGTTNMHIAEAAVSGPLFELPGGTMRLAAGVDVQRYNITPVVGAPAGVTTRWFERDVDSVYAELLMPFVGPGNARPGLRKLALNIAGRYDEYSDVGNTTNPKIGIDWSPIDSLTVRTSYGESFRAPGIAQIYGNTNRIFIQNYSDPTQGGALRIGATLSGGNLNLEPESSSTWTLSLDFAPESVPGLRTSLTYFDIDYDGQVTQFLQDLTILNRESEFAGTGIIVRNPDQAFVQNLITTLGVTGTPPPVITLFVDGRSFNLGSSTMQGFDLQARYGWDSAIGQFSAGLTAALVTSYDFALTPAAPARDFLNTIYNPLKRKIRADFAWRRNGLQASAQVNHIGSYTNNLTPGNQGVDTFSSLDLYLGYTFGGSGSGLFAGGITAALDVTNVLDEDPPFVDVAQSANGGGAFDPTLVNPLGRVIGVSLRAKF